MEKRLFLAIALSLAVLLFWSAFMTKTYHIDNKEVTKSQALSSAPAPAAPVQVPEKTSVPGGSSDQPAAPLLTFDRKNSTVFFTESGAAINKVVFKKHQKYEFPLTNGFLLLGQDLRFKNTATGPHSITFSAQDSEKQISKKFIFSDDNYDLWLEMTIINTSSSAIKMSLPLEIGQLDFSNSARAQFLGALVKTDEKAHFLGGKKTESFNNVNFAGIKDQYFCVIIDPEQENYTAGVTKINGQMSNLYLTTGEITVAPNAKYEVKYHIYLGPQEINIINNLNPDWAVLVNYGTFDFISQLLLQMLYFIYKVVHNWGWAIIILSILVYFCLYPLTLKQMRSMKEMQLLQPHIEELKAKYKDNPQKLNKEIMELYRLHKVNPLGGCLPLVLQMPIFFALYQALMRSVVLKGADFLWIKDLSQPDRLFLFPSSLPFLGNEFNILPIIMAIGMFFQQKISMSSTSVGSSAEQQKMMLVIFPVLFGFIFYHMPSGLVLYWLTNSILTVTFQFKTKQIK